MKSVHEKKRLPNILPQYIIAIEQLAETFAERFDIESLTYFIDCLEAQRQNRLDYRFENMIVSRSSL